MAVVLGLFVTISAVLGGFYLRLSQGPVSLPTAWQARIIAQMQAGMVRDELSIADMSIALDETGRQALLVITDVTVRDETGLRAAFPQLGFYFDAGALLMGQIFPIRAEMRGASLLLERDPTGGIDLAFTTNQDAARADLAQTMAAFDRMFADPRFANFQEAIGREITISLRDATTGRALSIENGQMRLARQGQDLVLAVTAGLEAHAEGVADQAGRLSFVATRTDAARETELRLQFQGIPANNLSVASPAFRWLDLISAPLSGSLSTKLRDAEGVGDLEARLDLGPGELALEGAERPLSFSEISARFRYEAATGRAALDELLVDARDLDFTATGDALISPDGTQIDATLDLNDLLVNPNAMFEAPLLFSQGRSEFRISLGEEPRLDLDRVLIRTDAYELTLAGYGVARSDGTELAIDGSIAQMVLRDALIYWPNEFVSKTRDWIDRNLHEGQAQNLVLSLRKAPQDARAQAALGFDFSALALSPIRDMPPLRDLQGQLRLEGARLTIVAQDGLMRTPTGQDIVMRQGRFTVPNVAMRGPAATLDLDVSGEILDLLTLFAGPPLNLFPEDGSLDPATLATGQAELSGQIGLNLVQRQPIGEMSLDITGRLIDVRSDTLVPNRDLRAEALDLAITSEAGVMISGAATMSGQPLTGRWVRPDLNRDAPQSYVEGQARLSPETLATFGVILPDGMVQGDAALDLRLDLAGRGAAPELRLTSPLEGVALSLTALGWTKPAEAAGDLDVTLILGPDPSLRAFRLSGAGLSAQGSGDLSPEGRLELLRIEGFTIDDWLDVTGTLTPRGEGLAPALGIASGRLDLRGLPQGGSQAQTARAPLSVNLDELRIGATIALSDLRADLSFGGGGLAGAFRGNLNGAVPLEGAIAPLEGGVIDIRLQADDGGAAMRSAGIMRNLYGGALTLQLQGATGARSYEGQLQITNPRLRDAPVMAELLNAVSVIGLIEQLSGDGINMGEVNARFTLDPSKITVHQGTAIGPSLGISMDGVYNTSARNLDFRGVLTPIYALNGVFGRLFARRDEGLFGFNFTLNGPPNTPQVRVNPLSILVPGILRDLMRPQLDTNSQ